MQARVLHAEAPRASQAAFDERRFQLIEALAQHLAGRLFEGFPPIDWVTILVRKPSAPIAMVTGEAAIEITRRRKDA